MAAATPDIHPRRTRDECCAFPGPTIPCSVVKAREPRATFLVCDAKPPAASPHGYLFLFRAVISRSRPCSTSAIIPRVKVKDATAI